MRSHYLQLLSYYKYVVAFIIVALTSGVAAFSAVLLFAAPLYTATATVSLLPTQAELTFSQAFVRSTSFNPANLLTQTHIENLISREISKETIDKLIGKAGSAPPGDEDSPGTTGNEWIDRFSQGFQSFRREFRRIYMTLNSGKFVPADPYTDLVNGLQEAISIDMLEGTYILRISVSWDDPEFAAAAANMLSETYLERARAQARQAALAAEEALRKEMAKGEGNVADLQRQINALRLERAGNISFLRVIDPAVPPVYPSFPKVVVNTVAAGISAVILSIILVIAADTISKTLKTDADLSRVLGPTALGRIRAKRPGARQLKEISRRINLQCLAVPAQGGVMSMEGDADSTAAARIIQRALTGLESWKDLPAGARQTAEPTSRRGRIAPQIADPTDDAVADLGGATGQFSMARIEPGQGARPIDWVVIALRPGRVTEDVLQSTIAELRAHGARQVFGLYLVG